MKQRRTTRGLLAAAICGALALAPVPLAPPARAQTAAEQVAASAAELEKRLAALKLQEEEARQLGGRLRDVGAQARAGRLRLALNRLSSPWTLVAAHEYAGAKSNVKEVASLEAEWKRMDAELSEKERRLASLPAHDSALAARALAESAIQQARPYHQSGRLYGLNTTIPEGLLYLGLAPALLDFALYVHGLRLGPAAAAPRLRSLAPELGRAEAETLAAYRRAEAAAAPDNQQQLQFNRVNGTLKLAGELDRAGRHAGALHKYLEALLLLGLTTDAPLDAAETARLRERAAGFERRLRDARADHSLGLLYLESAQAALEGQPDAEAQKRAAVLLGRVLPAYLDFCCGEKR